MIELMIKFTAWYFGLMLKIVFWPFKLIINALKEEHESYASDDFASRYTPPSFDDPAPAARPAPKIRKTFGSWPAYIHQEPEQIARQERGLSDQYIPITLDRSAKTGKFRGSCGEEYRTTLESCDCMDFKKRNLPCKHMYRLAMELEKK